MELIEEHIHAFVVAIRGIDADFGPYQADTFFNDLHTNLRADFIMANERELLGLIA